MAKEPILETKRLILRPLTVADASACFEWASDERVAKFMSYTKAQDISEEIEWLKLAETDTVEYNWGFVLKENGELIGSGSIGPNKFMDGYWGIGYNIKYNYWNKGLTTEAMQAVINYVYNELGVKKICADHAIDNPASGKVMEKCGLKFHHYGEYSKLDGSATFEAKFYTLELD